MTRSNCRNRSSSMETPVRVNSAMNMPAPPGRILRFDPGSYGHCSSRQGSANNPSDSTSNRVSCHVHPESNIRRGTNVDFVLQLWGLTDAVRGICRVPLETLDVPVEANFAAQWSHG